MPAIMQLHNVLTIDGRDFILFCKERLLTFCLIEHRNGIVFETRNKKNINSKLNLEPPNPPK